MTYNLSKRTVERWAGTLDLLNGKEVLFKSTDPHKLAYRLREAIAAARANRIKPYADLFYGFTVKGELVIARPKAGFVMKPVRVTKRFEGVVSEWGVTNSASEASEDILEFPRFIGGSIVVANWCSANGYEMTTEPYLVLRRVEHESD